MEETLNAPERLPIERERSERSRFLDAVLRGLSATPRALPCKYFYDKRGSLLFDRITELEEYYPTRAETDLLLAHARDIAERLGRGVDLVELGSGSSIKTRILLDALLAGDATKPARYVPVDISAQHLADTAEKLRRAYPTLRVEPLAADYAKPITSPPMPAGATKRAVFFPGSSIGNFEPDEAVAFLARARQIAGSGGVVLVGVDLPKDALGGKIRGLLIETARLAGDEEPLSGESILVDDRFLGAGYAKAGAVEREAIHLFARREGILLDPVYTARAAGGMLEMIRRGEIGASEKILFWHTGGTPALWAYADAIR